MTATSGRILQVMPGPACQVPAVLTLTARAAKTAVTRAGCRARVRTGAARGPGPVRVVVQSVSADRVLGAGHPVTLTVARTAQRCAYDPTRWRTVASDGDVVVAQRQTPARTPDGMEHGYLSSCTQSDGTKWRLDSWQSDGVYGDESAGRFVVAGTWVAFVRSSSEKDYGSSRVVVADLAARRRRTVEIGGGDWEPYPYDTSLAVNAAGAAAWTTTTATQGGPRPDPCDAVHVQPVFGPARTLVTSPTCNSLTEVSIDATSVHWKENGAARSAPIS
jgi:hypothetical protein